ncbi:MAG: hypothetical protein QM490_01315, partial [Candidatus Gracilibacteria bacterium]
MSKEMMQIPVKDLLESLKSGYEEYRDCLANGNDKEDLGHIKGYCTTIEQILAAYAGVTSSEMLEIKNPIIGNVSLKRKKTMINYDEPTYLRRQRD